MAPKISSPWLGYAVVGILFVVLFFGLYYFAYVGQHGDQIETYAFHELRASSEYIQDALGRLEGNIGNALNDPRAEPEDSASSAIEGNLAGIRGLADVQGLGELQDVSLLDSAKAKMVVQPGEEDAAQFFTFRLEQEGQRARLHLTVFKRLPTGRNEWVRLRAAADLEDLLQPLLPREPFDLVVLSRQDGTVLMSQGGGALQFTRLPVQGTSAGADGEPAPRPDPSAASFLADEEVAGNTYRMFVQPFRVPVEMTWADGETSEDVWLLAGFMHASAFRDRALAVSPNALLASVGLFVLTILALPFLKIWFLGPREPLKRHDVFVLAVATVILSSSFAVAALGLFTYYRFQYRHHERLETLAASIGRAFRAETDALDRQLRTLTDSLASSPPADSLRGHLLDTSDAEAYPFFELAFWANEKGMQRAKWSVRERPTPLISVDDRAYFVEAKNRRLWASGTPPDAPTAPGYVIESIRSKNTGDEYAVLAQRVDGVAMRDAAEPDTLAVAAILAPLLSVVDPVLPPGYGFALLADDGRVVFHQDKYRNLRETFFDEVEGGDQLREANASRSKRALKADYKETPYLFQFEPVPDSPWTLAVFHELTSLRALYARILTRALLLYIVYVGSLLLLFALVHKLGTPGVPPSDLFVWTWPDDGKQPLYRRIVMGEAVVAAILCWFVLSPPAEAGSDSVAATWVFALIGFFVFYALMRSGFYATQKEPPEDWAPEEGTSSEGATVTPEEATPPDWQSWYFGALGLLVLVVGLLPPASFVQAVFDEEVELYTKRRQLYLAQSLHQRDERLAERYRALPFGENGPRLRERLFPEEVSSRSVQPWDIHLADPSVAITRTTVASGERSDHDAPWWASLLDLLPGVTPWLSGLDGYASDAASDGSWYWSRPHADSLTLHVPRHGQPTAFEAGATSSAPYVLGVQSRLLRFRELTPPWVTLLTVLLLLGAFLLVVRSVLRRVYLMDALHPRIMDGALLLPEEGGAGLRHRLWLRRAVDLGGETDDEGAAMEPPFPIRPSTLRSQGAAELIREARSSRSRRIAIERFHEGLDEAETAEAKLALLEGLLDLDDKTIEVRSTINPLHYFRMRARESRGDAPNGLGRWAAVLATFVRTRQMLARRDRTAETERFAEMLATYRNARLDREAKAAHSASTWRALWWVAEECWPDPYLQRVGRLLAAHPHLDELDTREHVILQVLDLTEAYYQHLWAISGRDEKIILYRIATEGFVSWNSQDLVRRLIHRGLVHARPQLEVMNRSFRQFIRDAEPPEVYTQWERSAGTRPWARLRGPVVTALLVLALFFFIAEPGIIEKSLVFVTAAAAGIPALVKVLALLAEPHGHTKAEE